MIHPRPANVTSFLWDHLEKDLRVLGHALNQNLDNTAITVHLILRVCAEHTAGDVSTCSPFTCTHTTQQQLFCRRSRFIAKHIKSLCSLFSKVLEIWTCRCNRDDNSGSVLCVILPSTQSFRYESGTGGPSHTHINSCFSVLIYRICNRNWLKLRAESLQGMEL